MSKIDVNSYNPYPAFRVGQKEAIEQILASKNNVVELSMPTGGGKSLVLTIMARAERDRLENYERSKLDEDEETDYTPPKAIYTTPLVSLVEQIRDDALLQVPSLVGKSNYPCALIPDQFADDCPFSGLKIQRPAKCEDCQYEKAKRIFKLAPMAATTLDRFMYDPSIKASAKIVVIDESSGLEKKLIDHADILLPDFIRVPNLLEDLIKWHEELILSEETAQKRSRKIAEKINLHRVGKPKEHSCENCSALFYEAKEESKILKQVQRKLRKIGYMIRIIKEGSPYIIDKERHFKLLKGDVPFKQLCKNRRVVLASGTPCTDLLSSDFEKVVTAHPIPKEARWVYYIPIGKMSMNYRSATIPKMAVIIKQLHEKYSKNTIVHCHSYGIAQEFKNLLGKVAMLQNSKDREASLNDWKESKNKIFLSVKYEEGIDLKGDQFPINIIAKIPFQYLGDEWVNARDNLDNKAWSNKQTAIDVQQAAGRCTRDPKDYSETYILDASFGNFYRNNMSLFEPWFQEALVFQKKAGAQKCL
jgi:Rad3-related DNA helicase